MQREEKLENGTEKKEGIIENGQGKKGGVESKRLGEKKNKMQNDNKKEKLEMVAMRK